MSRDILVCPECKTPVVPKQPNAKGWHGDWYTCDGCRITMRKDRFKTVRDLTIARGAPLGGDEAPPQTGLLGIFRPPSVMGDQSNSTYNERSSSIAETLVLDWTAITDRPVGGIIDHIIFKIRVSSDVSSQGPSDPVMTLKFREDPGGAERTAISQSIGASSAITDYASAAITVDDDGNPWTNASVNSIAFRSEFVVDDGGSQETTAIRVYEVWIEAWSA